MLLPISRAPRRGASSTRTVRWSKVCHAQERRVRRGRALGPILGALSLRIPKVRSGFMKGEEVPCTGFIPDGRAEHSIAPPSPCSVFPETQPERAMPRDISGYAEETPMPILPASAYWCRRNSQRHAKRMRSGISWINLPMCARTNDRRRVCESTHIAPARLSQSGAMRQELAVYRRPARRSAAQRLRCDAG
jgi:hypothetical protein